MPAEPPQRPRTPGPKTARIREGSVLFRYVVPAALIVIGLSLAALVIAVVLVVLGVFPGL